jgi:hypothetical protein
MDESSMSQNRRPQRSKLLMAAVLETAMGSTKVTLRNLSAEGALVEGDRIPEAGQPLVFRKNELEVSGKVAWASERRAGIAFDATLQPETVLRHIPEPRHRAELSFKRPGLSSPKLSDEERRWCETFIWDRPLPSMER